MKILQNRGMAEDLVLSLQQARRLAVRGQYLAGPEPAKGIDGMRRVLRGLRVLQIDPVNVVARSHLLVLWSRLGGFARDDLDTLLWRERWLFEYWAHAASIVLTEDYPIHRAMMRAYTATVESQQKRDWLAANEERDVRPEAQAEVRLLRDASAGRRAADRAGGAAGEPAERSAYRGGDVRRARVRRCRRAARWFGGRGDRIARVVRGRRFGQLLRPGVVRRILSTGESAGRSRRAQAR